MSAYRITDHAELLRPSVTDLATGAAVPVAGVTLADATDALMLHASGRRYPIASVLALSVELFGTAMRRTYDGEVPAERVARFCEAVGRVSA